MMEDKEGNVLIGKGVSLVGNITLAGSIYVYGDVNGAVVAQEIHVGESGKISGDIKADVADIRGEISNSIEVKKSIVVRSTGRILGKLIYQSLEIESGGVIDGQIEKAKSKNDFVALVASNSLAKTASSD
jgi:cytoskeletal protein CcmA (bactofilin family)